MTRAAPATVAQARARVTLANARALRRLEAMGARQPARLAGRIARDLPSLDGLDATAPELALIAAPDLAATVIDAAAAALIAHDLAAAITPQARAEFAEVLDDKSRAFALHHRALSRPAGGDTRAALAVARDQVRDAWLRMLPPPLAAEFGADALPPPGEPSPAPPRTPQRRSFRLFAPRSQQLPVTQDAIPDRERPPQALRAALAHFGEVAP